MKKVLLIFGALLFTLVTSTKALAAPSVVLNGQNLTFDVPPIVENGCTLVPLRAIFEALGANVNWDGKTQVITAIKGEITIKLQINSKTAYKNGQAVSLEVPSQIVENRTLVPLRFVSEALGANVQWDNSTQRVIIKSPLPSVGQTGEPVNITSGLEYIYAPYSNSMVTFVERDKLPLPLQGFAKISVLSNINKEETSTELLNDYYKADKTFYNGEPYNSAGYCSVLVDFDSGNSAVFLFDKNDKLLGYHLINKEELSIHQSPFVDIHITLQPGSPDLDEIRPLDFKVSKFINGKIDPEYEWAGGCGIDEDNQFILKCFLSGDNVTYKVESVKDEVKIQNVQIVPTEWTEW